MTSTIIQRLQAIAAPPLVQVALVPAHQLMTLKTYHGTGQDGHVITLYEDPSAYLPPLRVNAYKIGLNQDQQMRPFMTPPLLRFVEQHCRTCPHNFPAETNSTPCAMRKGWWREAFDARQITVPRPAGYGVDAFGEATMPTPMPRDTVPACYAGHQDPSDWNEFDRADRSPPVTFLSPQPVSVSVTLSLHNVSQWGVNHMVIQHLVKHQDTYYVSRRIGHLNTFNDGQRICWGQNNRQPPLVSALDTFHGAIFNLDLTNDFDDWINKVESAALVAANVRDLTEDQQLRYLKDKVNGFTAVDSDAIVSINNEINGFINIPPGSNEVSPYENAYNSLAASGCPVSKDTGLLLPIKRHVINAGDRLIHGFITPIIPAIGRCWFIQQVSGDAVHGQLLGQIDPPENV